MHFAISATYGPTDPTRAMLPFIFAASAVQSDDQVTLMLFADLVLMAVEGVGAKLVPVGPPNKYEEIAGNPNVTLLACKPCMEARGLTAQVIDKRVKLAGMNEFHAATKRQDAPRGELLAQKLSPQKEVMTKPIADKAEWLSEYPDKFFVGTFERSSRFEAHLDPTGFALLLERPRAGDTTKINPYAHQLRPFR